MYALCFSDSKEIAICIYMPDANLHEFVSRSSANNLIPFLHGERKSGLSHYDYKASLFILPINLEIKNEVKNTVRNAIAALVTAEYHEKYVCVTP
jgi:hypothetical protein